MPCPVHSLQEPKKTNERVPPGGDLLELEGILRDTTDSQALERMAYEAVERIVDLAENTRAPREWLIAAMKGRDAIKMAQEAAKTASEICWKGYLDHKDDASKFEPARRATCLYNAIDRALEVVGERDLDVKSYAVSQALAMAGGACETRAQRAEWEWQLARARELFCTCSKRDEV